MFFNGSKMKSRATAAAAVSTALTATAVFCTVLAFSSQRKAEAFPPFSKKEKKPCSYCHVNKAGGGKRTVAGDWYKTHKLSFVGFKPAGAAKAPVAAKTAKPAAKAASAAKKATKPAAPKKPARKSSSPPPKKG